jgi:predicted RND superfamily exporter protein
MIGIPVLNYGISGRTPAVTLILSSLFFFTFTPMFTWLARFILRNRITLLIIIGLLTAFMGYKAFDIRLSYDFAKILPENDVDYIAYENFKKTFGEDGSVMVIGVEDQNFFRLQKFNDWWTLGNEIKKIDGIEAVVSLAGIYSISKNEAERKFDLKPLITKPLNTQEELDSIRMLIENMPFYKGFIYNPASGASVMAITFNKAKLNSKNRITIINIIKEKADAFGEKHNLQLHYSGLPYIRTAITAKVSAEMKLFLMLALIVTAGILFIFFRSFQVMIYSMLIVVVGVIWSLGTIALMGYKITILSGLIPPLIIVIGVPNCILLLNKYHMEFSRHGKQARSLARMIQKIGFTTFLANVTTAIGFFVFYFTNSNLLVEFGLVAAANVMTTCMLSIVLIPIIFSFLPQPQVKHTQHLQSPRINRLLESIEDWVKDHHRVVYATVIIMLVISGIGITRLSTVGYVVDDLPKKDPVYLDMKFFEKNFHGVLPLEIAIDTRETGNALQVNTLQKINRLQKMLAQYPELSRPISIVEAVKFAYQAYKEGNEKYYILPGSIQLAELSGFIGDSKGKEQLFKSFIDSTKQITRVSVQMADVGSVKMKKLVNELRPRIDSIFDPAKYTTAITGNSRIFLKGNDYLFENLIESILLAVLLISIIMILLFMSLRMILISIIPSLIPLIITAGVMGFTNVPLKPSTILVFSIAFGIASDQTIYFLTKYRQEMRAHKMISISKAVSLTISETGVSMIYTAVILFCGFFIFSVSDFGGTASLGKLISFTLLMAVCANLILLPTFLVGLERKLTTKAFLQEPLFEIHEEEGDIDLDELEVKK